MKKTVLWLLILSYAVFFIAWLMIGLKIADHDYAYRVEAYIALGALAVNLLCHIIRLFSNKCPHCGMPIVEKTEDP